jgi:hypothetical protein
MIKIIVIKDIVPKKARFVKNKLCISLSRKINFMQNVLGINIMDKIGRADAISGNLGRLKNSDICLLKDKITNDKHSVNAVIKIKEKVLTDFLFSLFIPN